MLTRTTNTREAFIKMVWKPRSRLRICCWTSPYIKSLCFFKEDFCLLGFKGLCFLFVYLLLSVPCQVQANLFLTFHTTVWPDLSMPLVTWILDNFNTLHAEIYEERRVCIFIKQITTEPPWPYPYPALILPMHPVLLLVFISKTTSRVGWYSYKV